MDLKGRDFLKLLDFTPEEIEYLLDLAADLKDKKKKGIPVDTLRGKNVALIFEKTSTRTRCAFEVAAHDLGMGTTYLDPTGSQIGKKESIADTARVLAGMFEGIEYRGFDHSYVEELIADIQQNIHSKLKKKAPAFFERYGKDMYYITYQRNSNTTWYIFFSVIIFNRCCSSYCSYHTTILL